MIAEMSRMGKESPSECEVVPSPPARQQLLSQVNPISQALTGDNTADGSRTSDNLGQAPSRTAPPGLRMAVHQSAFHFKDNESAFHSSNHQPIVRCTPEVWDTIMKQISILKKEKTEALAKLAALERDGPHLTQANGDDSSELDELRYRLQVNKDYKAAMSRDIRQKDNELSKKELELEGLRKEVADTADMREQIERLRAEVNFLRSEAEKHRADAGQITQLVEFKDQEISQLKDSLASNSAKVSDHQKRAENLVDTQTTREKKL